jgi:hypothetical protein
MIESDVRITPLSFEHTCEISEADYVALHQFVARHSFRSVIRQAAVAIVGALMLLSVYTAAVGVLLILITAFVWSAPFWMARALRTRFRETASLRGPVAYGVSHRGFWLQGDHFGAEADWSTLRLQKEIGGWLMLSSAAIPPVYLPVAELREREVYAQVVTLARRHLPPAEGGARGR